ncbi:MAG: glucosamine-6-phosphate deaminase [Candidatus Obscuribacterales bacterium]|nr:glucosamine-6-phosphate deaminase [Candidatus Obscuribacterales bacterium]
MLLELTKPIESERQTLPQPEAYQALSKVVAEVVVDLVKEKPDACIGFPTGRTPRRCYEILSERSQQGAVDWKDVRCFGLDEYVDADEQHSFRTILNNWFYQNINVSKSNLFNPLFQDDYDACIKDKGGLDLCILGLGQNGHIAFNEPGTPLSSWTHSVWLSESTRAANAEFFQGGTIPTRAVTMGLSTILASRRIILIVSGVGKKDILTRAMRGKISSEVPASYLQNHDNVMVLADFEY